MSKKKQKAVPQRNLVAKYARDFNKTSSEVSKKNKVKHRPAKHKNRDSE